ncbi:site-specific DNA-methyltransferase [Caedibacter taeniospiralis]|uniref:site-specific DNA-methyltransferase n=1 Tax=Caedibacter taeniospiralis TaxID=28907 RepID=UPI000C27A96B|nr:DNA methyltransferase [Caedibacter taeniospiralis]
MENKIEYLGIDELMPYKNNARTHSENQINKIAASMQEFGFIAPVVINDENMILAGHGRLIAAKQIGLQQVPVVRVAHLTKAQQRAYTLADNRIADDAGWDDELLKIELSELNELDFDLTMTGFEDEELNRLIFEEEDEEDTFLTDEEDCPAVENNAVSVYGDVWLLGEHRVMCGDSTVISDVKKLVGDEKAQLLHADPPYGMGKASDGVANDNLYDEKLDDFQMAWWVTFRTFVADNASAYIWDNAPELWRLWYKRLEKTEHIELRNQIVWDKKSIAGMKSELMTQFPIATEHCLFMQLGKQFIGSINAEDYPEEYEVIRTYLADEAQKAGVKQKDMQQHCNCQMYAHWFTKSQFTLIPQKHYKTLQAAYPEYFKKSWSELKKEWDKLKGKGSEFKAGKLQSMRSYFDNAHEVMRDVWEFPRVVGDERHGHATPKPVAMMERIMKSSLPAKGLCLEPFGGSGATLIGAEKTKRKCYTMELQPCYVDVIVKRWQSFTGKEAIHLASGKTFNQLLNTADEKVST